MFLRVVMCTLLWREPEHFGFPEGYEGTSPFSLVVTVVFAPYELVVCVEFSFHSYILWQIHSGGHLCLFGVPGLEERRPQSSAEANGWIRDAFWKSRQTSLKSNGYKVLGTYY